MLKLPHMTVDPKLPGVIVFDGDSMAGMIAGLHAADIALACNSYPLMVAALLAAKLDIEERADPCGEPYNTICQALAMAGN